jgi:hypothetical protein
VAASGARGYALHVTAPPGSLDPSLRLEAVLGRARRRLRSRHAAAAAAVGAHVGCWLALPAALVGGALGGPVPAVAGAAAVIALAAGAGAVIGAARGTLDRRSTAFALDRLTNSDELLLNAVHALDTPGDRNREAILARLEGALPDPAAFAWRRPRHLRFAPLPLVLAAVGLLVVPRLPDPRSWWGAEDPVAAVGQDLKERLDRPETEAGVELPPELRKDLGRLADELAGGELSKEEAERRLAEMQRQLGELEKSLAGSQDLMKDLEQAANELREQAPALADDLASGDLESSSAAAQELAQHLAESGSPEERRAAGEALERAGRELASSTDPSLRQAGEAMQEAGESMQQGDGTLSPEQQQALADELAKARETGRQLANDREAMRRSQEAAAAVESARQRLGGEASVEQGEGEGEGEGEGQGEGEGEGQGEGEGEQPGSGPPGNSPGAGHTWEDQGEFGDEPGKEGTATAGKEKTHEQIDDFQKLYEELRLEGAKSLVTGTGSQLNDQGRVDVVETRLTTAEEVARAGAVELPAGYRDAATEAVQGEQVPAGYRDVVKQYFDGME